MQPIADWTQHLQGTKYPTLPLVLPTTYGLIERMSPSSPLTIAFPDEVEYELEPEEMHPGVLEARTAMYNDWVTRWITNLDPEAKRIYAIATLMHPCFKEYDFIDDFDLIPKSDKAWAIRELRNEWRTAWKPGPVTNTSPEQGSPEAEILNADQCTTELVPPLKKKKARSVTLGSLLGGRAKKEKEQAPVMVVTEPELDELEQYLTDPEKPDLDMNLLSWWCTKEKKWPNLTKMVKQYLAAPASSAGVERVFSATGKMHNDLKKSAKDETLEHSLFAAFNTD